VSLQYCASCPYVHNRIFRIPVKITVYIENNNCGCLKDNNKNKTIGKQFVQKQLGGRSINTEKVVYDCYRSSLSL